MASTGLIKKNRIICKAALDVGEAKLQKRDDVSRAEGGSKAGGRDL